MALVFMFPGQSSRYPGMLDKLCELHPPNARLRSRASERLGRDLERHYAGPDPFERNVDVQIGVFLANHMFLQALRAAGVEAELSLGLSLGEWNHLVHIGAISFEDALLAVRERGEAYDDGPRGWMASIQPMGVEDLREALSGLAGVGTLEIVNLNSPRQNVIAGDQAAVEAAVELLEDEHYVQAVIIEKNVPMHASSFAPVAARFRRHLEGLSFGAPRRPYLPNRLGRIVNAPTDRDFVDHLSAHVCSPVLWRRSIDYLAEHRPGAVFVEVGPKSVLCNLLNRKWCRNRKLSCDSAEDTAEHFASVVEALRDQRSADAEPGMVAG